MSKREFARQTDDVKVDKLKRSGAVTEPAHGAVWAWRGCTAPVGARRVDGAVVQRDVTIPIPPVARSASGSMSGEKADMARGARRTRGLRAPRPPGRRVVLRGKIRDSGESLSSPRQPSLRTAVRDPTVKESLSSLFVLPRAGAAAPAGRAWRERCRLCTHRAPICGSPAPERRGWSRNGIVGRRSRRSGWQPGGRAAAAGAYDSRRSSVGCTSLVSAAGSMP